MQWQENSLPHKTTVLILTASEAGSWKEVAEGVSTCLCRMSSELAVRLKLDEWDRIICDVWFDSGRIIFLPTKRGATKKPRFIVQFVCAFLQKEFDTLPNVNDLTQILNLRHKVFQAFQQATDDKATKKALKTLKKMNDVRIFLQFGSDEDTRQEHFMLW